MFSVLHQGLIGLDMIGLQCIELRQSYVGESAKQSVLPYIVLEMQRDYR